MSAADLENLARTRMPGPLFDFISGGAGDEATVAANRAGFSSLRLRLRVLREVAPITMATTVAGSRLGAPILVAPMAALGLIEEGGEAAAAAGASEAGVGFVLSARTRELMDAVAPTPNQARWVQIYVSGRRDIARELVARAESRGYGAICVTTDVPVLGFRRRDLRNGFLPFPGGESPPIFDPIELDAYSGVSFRAPVTWRDLEWLKAITNLPVIAKGVMTAEDARIAVESGLDGIIVSNHGGRQLDHGHGAIEVLGEVAQAASGRAAVVLDGGVRSGSEIAASLCMGASAVSIGRPILWALAAGGQAGVATFLRALVQDLARTMVMIGARSVADLSPSMVEIR
jgi:4-hydroxymandelate oxidase